MGLCGKCVNFELYTDIDMIIIFANKAYRKLIVKQVVQHVYM